MFDTEYLGIPSNNSLIEDPYLAKWMYERIVQQINSFERTLSDNMQAGGRFISSNKFTFSIDEVSFWNPDMIIFYGTGNKGEALQLLQHTSQLNLLLVAVPRTDDLSKPRRKIGFAPPEDTEQL